MNSNLSGYLKSSQYTHVSSSGAKGVLKLSNGFKMVWGSENSTLLKNDSTVGGYSYSVSLSSYGLSNPIIAFVSPIYNQGFPTVAIKSITSSSLVLSSNVSGRSGYYIHWMVIG